jgi:hypothetical protein
MPKLLTFFLPAALCGTFASAQIVAQPNCPATTSSIVGAYGYTATEVPLSGVTITPPGTNPVFSNTPIGNLIGGITNGGQFWLAGVLYFDGAGNISVAPSSSSQGGQTTVGTYSVGNDCTISVRLNDVFTSTSVTNSGITSQTVAGTGLVGLVLGGGSQIVLSAPQSSTSTNGNTPMIAGQFGSRLTIELVRAQGFGCSSSTLNGAYGLIGAGFDITNAATSSTTTTTGGTTTTTGGVTTTTGGTTTTVAGTEQPATFFAVVRFDGNGNVIAQTVGGSSPLASFQMTGTYTVNLDCSGSMTLNTASTSATTGTTSPALKVSFVLTPPAQFPTPGAIAVSGYSSRPGIEFTAWNANETFFGLGTAQ